MRIAANAAAGRRATARAGSCSSGPASRLEKMDHLIENVPFLILNHGLIVLQYFLVYLILLF
jgi:hypothetical protein